MAPGRGGALKSRDAFKKRLLPCSSRTSGFLEGALLPAEQDVHVLTEPPTDADPAGHGAQLDSSTT
jgi:hypothetical protein